MPSWTDPDLEPPFWETDFGAASTEGAPEPIRVDPRVYVLITRMAAEWVRDCPMKQTRVRAWIGLIEETFQGIKGNVELTTHLSDRLMTMHELNEELVTKLEKVEDVLELYRSAAELRPERQPTDVTK